MKNIDGHCFGFVRCTPCWQIIITESATVSDQFENEDERRNRGKRMSEAYSYGSIRVSYYRSFGFHCYITTDAIPFRILSSAR